MTKSIEKQITMQCTPELAFKAFVEKVDLWWPPGHRKFSGSMLRFETRVGGKFIEEHPREGSFVFGEVLEYSPPQCLKFTWNLGKISLPTLVFVRFIPTGSETQVLVQHSEGSAAMGEKWSDRAALFEAGWTRILADLAAFVNVH